MNQAHSIDLQRTYERRFSSHSDYRRRVWTILLRDYFQELVPVDGTVLDLGCGWGEFATQVKARRVFAMDLNPSAPDFLNSSIAFFHQDCSTRWPLEDGTLDVVFTSNFFEHLPTKQALIATIGEAFRCLKPGGRIICLGPNIRLLPGRYWDFWDHFVPLSEMSLAEGLEVLGFEIERSVGAFLPYTMATGFNPPTWTVALYLRMPWAWRIFGKQFLVVGRRPGGPRAR